jgi:hypothetical protein
MRLLLERLAASILLFRHGYALVPRTEIAMEADAPKLSEMDWFYDAPNGFEKEALGTILRYRKTPRPIGINNTAVEVGDAWQILYRTQDAEGQPEATVLTILKPKQPKARGNLWVESYFSVSAFETLYRYHADSVTERRVRRVIVYLTIQREETYLSTVARRRWPFN